MEQQIQGQLKNRLQEKKQQLENQLNQFAKKDPHVKGDWDTTYPRIPEGNLEEAADEVEEYSTNLHLEFNLETQLKEVSAALERMEKGTYGLCEKCDKAIASERLAISPEARTCGACAT